MAEKDIILKEYQRDSRHFCDFVNGALAQGRPLLKRGQLVTVPTELVLVKDMEEDDENAVVKTIQRFRDITGKAGTDKNAGYIIVAIQNQTTVDYGMPLRVMLEDALEYDVQRRTKKNQKLHKDEKLCLVITLVFYYGTTPWRAPSDLAEMISVPREFRELREYIQSYPIVVVTPENVDTACFRGGWREILEILRRQNDEKEMERYLEDNRTIYEKLPEDTNRVIFALTDHLDYYRELKKKGEKITMCKAFTDHYKSGVEEGKKQGMKRGIKQGIRQGMDTGIRAVIETCRELKIPRNETKKRVMDKCRITEEMADRYMAKYW